MSLSTGRPYRGRTAPRSLVKRTHDRAALHWRSGRYHSARQAYVDAGLVALWPAFETVARTWGRRRFEQAMTRQSGGRAVF